MHQPVGGEDQHIPMEDVQVVTQATNVLEANTTQFTHKIII